MTYQIFKTSYTDVFKYYLVLSLLSSLAEHFQRRQLYRPLHIHTQATHTYTHTIKHTDLLQQCLKSRKWMSSIPCRLFNCRVNNTAYTHADATIVLIIESNWIEFRTFSFQRHITGQTHYLFPSSVNVCSNRNAPLFIITLDARNVRLIIKLIIKSSLNASLSHTSRRQCIYYLRIINLIPLIYEI